MDTTGLRGLASGGQPAPAGLTGLRRHTGIFENGRELRGASGTAGRGWDAFQNTPEAQAVRHRAAINAASDRNAEAIRNRQGIRTLGTMTGAEAAARVGGNPGLGGLRRGGDVFGRNDRAAALARNQAFIASGRASMFGPRPATTKGILALRRADHADMELANQRGLEGLRQRGAIEKERIAQEGDTRRTLIGARKDYGIEQLKAAADQRKTDALAQFNQDQLTEQGRQFDATMAQQEKQAQGMLAALRTPKPPSPEEALRRQYEADRGHFGSEVWDPRRESYYYTEGEGDQARRIYFGDQANNELIDSWANKNRGNFRFGDNLRWSMTDSDGNTRYAPDWLGEQLARHWSSTADGAEETAAGVWKNHGMNVNSDVATYLRNRKLLDQSLEALVRHPDSPYSRGVNPAGYNLMVDAYGNPQFLSKEARETPQGWRPAPQEYQARMNELIRGPAAGNGPLAAPTAAAPGLTGLRIPAVAPAATPAAPGVMGLRTPQVQPAVPAVPASGGGLEMLRSPSQAGTDEEFVTANSAPAAGLAGLRRTPQRRSIAPRPGSEGARRVEEFAASHTPPTGLLAQYQRKLAEIPKGKSADDFKPVMSKYGEVNLVPLTAVAPKNGLWRELTEQELDVLGINAGELQARISDQRARDRREGELALTFRY